MSTTMSNDVRLQYEKTFATIDGIITAFPEDKWLVPHGNDYYIPCRIAYHLALVIDRLVAGGIKDPNFKLPYGAWMEATAETLPSKDVLAAYFKEAVARAQAVLAELEDSSLSLPIEPEMAWMGQSKIGAHLYSMRELSAHIGELNKMLIENGVPDVWVAR